MTIGPTRIAAPARLAPATRMRPARALLAMTRPSQIALVAVIYLVGVLSPTLAELPAKIGRFDHSSDDYVAWRMEEVWPYSPFTAAFNATGQPAMSVPLAMVDGLPVGLHFAGRFGDDLGLMTLASELEEARPWFEKVPA